MLTCGTGGSPLGAHSAAVQDRSSASMTDRVSVPHGAKKPKTGGLLVRRATRRLSPL